MYAMYEICMPGKLVELTLMIPNNTQKKVKSAVGVSQKFDIEKGSKTLVIWHTAFEELQKEAKPAGLEINIDKKNTCYK